MKKTNLKLRVILTGTTSRVTSSSYSESGSVTTRSQHTRSSSTFNGNLNSFSTEDDTYFELNPYSMIVSPDTTTNRSPRNSRNRAYHPMRIRQMKALDKVQKFITRAKEYNFSIVPRPNPFKLISTCDDTIVLRENQKTIEERFKWSLLASTLQFDCSSLNKFERMNLFEAIILEQSYLQGYEKPVYTTRYFNSLWLSFKLRCKTDPNYICEFFMKSKSSKNNTVVNFLQSRFPKFLHNLYRYSVSVLGHDSSAGRIVSLMNPYLSGPPTFGFLFSDFVGLHCFAVIQMFQLILFFFC